MKTVFYIKTCNTCKRIMSAYDFSDWNLREIKSEPLTEEELSKMHDFTQSYEALFNRRSTQIKKQEIDVSQLKEEDFHRLILSHYSFLKRPVFMTDEAIFVGNSKKTIQDLDKFFDVAYLHKR